jgi:gliding motility-associated-like protein
MKVLYTFLLFTISLSIFSQRGKDGTVSITAAGTIVNSYSYLTADVPFNGVTLNVNSSAAFSPGDLVYIIQMQGASVNAGRDTLFPDVNSAVPTNTTYGAVTNYNFCGYNEFQQVSSVPNGTSIVLDCGVIRQYTAAGHVQVIKVPRYYALTVSGAGSITCPQWNGNTGGVAVVEVETNATLSSAGSFDVSGKGFRGGATTTNTVAPYGGNKYGSIIVDQGGYKGESIVGDTTRYKVYSSVYARGAMANGGGGGCSHNSGGGGGANGGAIASYNGYGNPDLSVGTYAAIWNRESTNFSLNTSSGGGRGGYSFSANNVTLNSSSNPPGSTNWGGDSRRAVGGFGGRPLDYSTGRVFVGGGGGAGNGGGGATNQAGAGGNGGGLVYIQCYGNLSGSGTILADGANGSGSIPGCGSNDAAGGGGGGGTIILSINGTTNLTAATALSAKGGNGGNVNFNCGLSNSTAYGPGAGGGGGYIGVSGALPGNSLTGGNNGIVTGNTSNIAAQFPPNGATKGGAGSTGTIATYTLTTSPNLTVCANQAFTLTASSTEPGTSLYWYNTIISNYPVVYSDTYSHPGFATPGTYTLYAGVCTGTYRQPVTINVTSGLSMNITGTSTICPGQSTVLTASGATTYTWVSGPSTNTISVSPASTTVYTVNGNSGLCAGSQTVNVTVSPTPTLSVANASICSGSTTTLTVASSASSFTWMPGGQTTSSIAVTPTINTTYTVTGSNGACTNTTTATINVTSTPTLATSPSTICAGQVATFTVSGATSYTWNPGNVTGSTFTLSPASSTTVSVTGANGTCTAQITSSLTVTPNPSITVASQTICPGQSTVLTANGAATYTWVSGPSTNTISVSPSSTTVYTVNGTSNSCTSSQTATVTVGTMPTIAVSGNTAICSGNSTTLTASGASSYTWASGGQLTSTVSLNPSSTTNYTVTGSNGVCSNTTTATVSVTPTPSLTANSVTICPGQTATLTVSGATGYTWVPGNVTGTTYTIAPSSNTFVTVTGANGSCTAQATPSVIISSGISLSVNNPTICTGQSATLTASGATTYTWTGGINTNTINVNPASTTVYSVSGTVGSCTGSTTSTVTVIGQPTISITGNTSICSGSSTTLTANGANTYTWAAGGQLTATVSLNPSSTTDYTITGSNGVCSSTTTATVSVTPTPTLTANSVTICPGQTATLTASGATTFTWMPGNVTGSSYTLAPSSNTFVTVTGANGSCTSQATPSVTIGTGITLSVNNATICTGQTASLTASGATTYTWDSGAQTNTLNVNPASTTIYTVSGTAGTCTGSTTSTVTVIGQPTISVTGNTTICLGGATTLTASGANSYTWAAGGELTATVSLNPSSTTDYTVTGDNGVCTNTTLVTVSVTPTPTLTANSVTICPAQTATLTVSGATTYTWNPGNVTGNTYTIAPSSNTFVTVTGANGSCTSQVTPSITIGTGISIGVNNPTICVGQTASLTASGATSYTWDSGAQTNTLNVNPASTTVYTVSGTAGTCTGSATSTVTVLNLPNLSVTGNTAICSGNSTTLTANGATSFTWASGGQLTAAVTVSPAADITYTVSGFDGACTNTTTVDVSVTPTPSLTASPVSICTGQTATLTVSGATTYTWNPGNVTGNTYTDSPASSSAYTVTGANGTCTSQVTTSITVGSGISIAINNPTICAGQSVVLTATSTATSYTWDSGANSNTLSVSPSSTTIYTVSGSSGSCVGVNTATVTVNPVPTLTVTSNDICAGQTSTLTVSGANTYTWSNGSNNSTQTVSPSATTIYTVSGTNGFGCVNTAVAGTTVNVNSVPNVTVNAANICAGQTATLTATGANTYSWSTSSTNTVITVAPVNTSTYSVVGSNGSCSSLYTTTVTVSQSPTLSVNASGITGCAPLCVTFTDVTSASCSTITYNFGDGNTGNTNNPNHCFNTSGNYTVTATCTNTLGCSSTYTMPSVVQVITTPVADFTISEGDMVTVGTTVNLTNTSSNALQYAWDYCNGVSTATDITTSYADTGSCCIILLASNATCTNSVTKCITIVNEATITIPNVFTPNGDNKNDIFKFTTIGIKDLSCGIYDRWGLKLYEWSGVNGGWDGSVKSAMAPDGTYFYILNYTDQKGESKTEKGFLSLFRD